MADASIVRSASTWQQPMPPPAGPERAAVVDHVVEVVVGLGDGRRRVAVDGFTAAGKTCFGHELARGLAARGRPVLRASLDDFKRPWAEAHRVDRTSGPGYYRNAFALDLIDRLLLAPAGPDGDGRVVLCSIDPLTQLDHTATVTAMPGNGVLVVDGVFAFRPELDASWDLRIWLDIDSELSVARGSQRDAVLEGSAEAAEALHRSRYLAAELLYVDEVDPRSVADVVIDNRDLDRPRLVRSPPER